MNSHMLVSKFDTHDVNPDTKQVVKKTKKKKSINYTNYPLKLIEDLIEK